MNRPVYMRLTSQEQPLKQSTLFPPPEPIEVCEHEETEIQMTLDGSTDRVCVNCGARV